MENQIIEYVRKSGRKPKRDEDGKIVVKGSGIGRSKKGVLFCGVLPDDPEKVSIGFSLCGPLDEFDYVNGNKEPGFGLDLAMARAEKWSQYLGFFYQNTYTEFDIENEDIQIFQNPDPKFIVEVPPSLEKQLKCFVKRCRNYFKDKEFPLWIEKLEKDEIEECKLVDVFFSCEDDDIFVPTGRID
jgi:hypothetical protein